MINLVGNQRRDFMDEKALQLREVELRVKEKELLNANISFHEKLDESVSKQENLRRAIEVGSNCYSKFDDNKIKEALQSLVLTAAIKLKDEILN